MTAEEQGRLSGECPSCRSDNPTANKFCGQCGSALSRTCPACGHGNPPANRYCAECGAPLEAAHSAAPASGPTAPPRRALPADAEERRLVTVVFADLVGFTALAERLDAEEVREITTECFRRLVAEVARYEGTVDKFIGDAVMALFGAPLAHEDDPARALRAALGMQRALAVFNAELERQRDLRLAVRIGVETGEVVAGVRDVGGVHEYTAIGDAVNVAARLQAAAEPDTILVGDATEQRTRSAFAFRAVPPLALKGREQPVPAHVLLGPRADGGTAAAQRAPLVGRAEEMQALAACLEELRRGRGQIAAVVGDPGLGKSRLLAELRARAALVSAEQASPATPIRWVRCQAFAHEQALSLGVARGLVRGLCELDEDTPEGASAGHLRARLRALGCPDLYPALAHLLTLPLGADEARPVTGLSPQELQRLTFGGAVELLRRLLTQGPLVLELDDLHWADPSSIDLLLELMGLAEHGALLFCCAFRPDRDAPAWALRDRAVRDFPHRYTEVLLRPLSEAASADLVARLLGLDEPPAELRENSSYRHVLERAAGTPLWVEELVRTLVERGLLVNDAGRWRVTADLDRAVIPDTLQALIVARIDRLGDARPALQTASVIGRRFGQRVLERITGDGPRLGEHLRVAQHADLVRELAAIPEREYGFKHVLTQEAAYATLLIRRRRELHRRVAEALEELYPERVDELHAVLVHHYTRAEAWDRALEHARAAAEAARASYANREAVEQYGHAIAAAERMGQAPGERLRLYEARAEVHEVIGAFEPARADYEAALRLAEETGDAAAEARLLGALAMLWGGHKDYQQGLELARRAVAVADAAGDERALARARVRAGVMLFNLARVAESRGELEAALALFREQGDEPGQAQVLDVLTMATLCGGELDAAIAYGREASRRLEALGDRATAATSMAMLGQALGYRGERAAGEEWIRRSLEIWAEIGARSGEAFGHLALTQTVEQFGAYDLAFRAASAGLSIARELDHREWTVANLAFLGRVRRHCGDAHGAQRLHAEALAIARELGATIWIAYALGELGQDLAFEGDEATATALLAEALETGGEARYFTMPALLAQAELALSRGRAAEALDAARHFRGTFPQFRVDSVDARRIEGEALDALGHAAEAEATLFGAKIEAVTLGADPPRWRTCLALGDLLRRTGRLREAGAQFAEALAALEAVASSLSDGDLRRAFAETGPLRRAREAARVSTDPASGSGGVYST